jgi:hypothetical protein
MTTSELGYHHDHPRCAWVMQRLIDVGVGVVATAAIFVWYFL